MLIGATFTILPRLGRGEWIVPAIVLIVGLHFFPMPPLYRARANLVTGAALTLTAIALMLTLRGPALPAASALAAGIILWCSSAWALGTAGRLLRQIGL